MSPLRLYFKKRSIVRRWGLSACALCASSSDYHSVWLRIQLRYIGEKEKNPGRPSLKIPVRMLENLRGLGFTWTRIAELLGVSRWTVHRWVAEYGLENTRGFDELPDERLHRFIQYYINNHWSASFLTLILTLIIWSCLHLEVSNLAAAFCTVCSLVISQFGNP